MYSTDMARVFLSYARKDSERAELLAGALKANGCMVFWDQDLLGGDDWRREIERRLGIAQCVIAVWSRNSIDSDWVKYEAARGHEKGILVPVSIDGSAPPRIFDPIHAENLANWDGSSEDPRIARMVLGIQKVLARQSRSMADEAELSSRQTVRGRRNLAGNRGEATGAPANSAKPRSAASNYVRLAGILVGVTLASITMAVAIIAPQFGDIPILRRTPQPAVRGEVLPAPVSRPELFMPVIESLKVPENAFKVADDVRAKANAVLDGSAVIVRKDDVGTLGTYYRVVVEPSRNLEQAEQICGRLKVAGFKNCFLIAQPGK